ncbi:MAG: HK97 family phage prohead protease [Lachnospiraceae bacterium]|nr:HK97 family phage prohead protease [Lachnospiraceae bacterium]
MAKQKTSSTQTKKQMSRELSFRAMEGEGNERRFEISFSSEEPYERWFGIEILDHSEGAVDLTRLQEMGVVLYNHNRDIAIGKVVSVSIEEGRGKAVIEIDTDEESEKIYQKMVSGTLKGVSVGYIVNNWEEVEAGKKSEDGRFQGPCSIAKKWIPYEVSIVTVPADISVGVGREMEENTEESKRSLAMFERQLLINKNLLS